MRRRGPRGPAGPRVAAAVLAPLVALAGCSESGAPSDASRDRFCQAFNSLGEADTGADFRDFADRLEAVGTPPDISNDGRAGFEVVIRVARSLESDATLEELENPSVSNSEERQAEEFLEYGSETCTSLDGGLGGGLAGGAGDRRPSVPDAPAGGLTRCAVAGRSR